MPDIIQLVKTNCRDCHCCIRYCPTKAIRYSGHQANIIGNMCVLCGECYRVCPHDAKSIVDGKEITKVLIQQSEGPVIASIDPAFPAFSVHKPSAASRQVFLLRKYDLSDCLTASAPSHAPPLFPIPPMPQRLPLSGSGGLSHGCTRTGHQASDARRENRTYRRMHCQKTGAV